jgi:hypothetical protein
MPADYTIDAERKVVFSRGTGVFTHADYRGHMAALGQEPLFQPTFHQLVDCRAITEMKLTGNEIKDLATRSLFAASSKRAFVASNSIQFGLSRMFASYREIHGKQEVRVFTELKEALHWLGLPEELDPYARKETAAS